MGTKHKEKRNMIVASMRHPIVQWLIENHSTCAHRSDAVNKLNAEFSEKLKFELKDSHLSGLLKGQNIHLKRSPPTMITAPVAKPNSGDFVTIDLLIEAMDELRSKITGDFKLALAEHVKGVA